MFGRLSELKIFFGLAIKENNFRTAAKTPVDVIANSVPRVSLAIPIPPMAVKPVPVLKLIVTLQRVVRSGRVR